MQPARFLVPAALTVALALSACGSKSNNQATSAASSYRAPAATTDAAPVSGPASTAAVSADPGGQLKFTTSALKAKAGKVTVDLSNPSPVPHAIAVEGNGVDKDGPTVSTGGHSTVTLDLKPGTYTFYCPVPGHRAAGMVGKLVVS